VRPIKTQQSNFVYRGPSDEVGDLWVQRDGRGGVFATYELTDADRAMLAEGGHLELGVYNEPIPPVSLRAMPAGTVTKVEDQKFRVPDDDLPKR
jgi:hypothetical protein